MLMRWIGGAASFLVLAAGALPLAGQDGNVLLPPDSIERLLAVQSFRIIDRRPSRGLEGERTDRAALAFPENVMLAAKWAPAAPGAEAFNNQPRFETAAYEIQKLFLDPLDYVVPPTVVRAFALDWYHANVEPDRSPTFRDTRSVLVTLQYWLLNTTGDDFWDEDRFQRDTAYARHLGDFNILTYLVRHNDANQGNFLISRDPSNPRVFAVDNGLSFSAPMSDRGADWRRMRLKRLPAATVARLRAITQADLTRRLETVAQFAIEPDGTLVRVEPTENFDPGDGVRVSDRYIQLGLTAREIREVWRRLEDLLEDVDRGRIQLF